MQPDTMSIPQEALFDINELFFSITSQDSTILSGNDVFVKISGYTKQELIGKFHNIIRHPDMPKIIFKTLWDYLKADKPIVAYVKNRTKEGGYYWVLAAVFPLNDQYVSIRVKPSTKIFDAVKEVYFKLLMVESKEDVEASGRMVLTLLNDLGYENYDHFMSDVLLKELQERKGLVSTETSTKHSDSTSALSDHLSKAHLYTKILMDKYDELFDKIDMFIQVKKIFEEKSLVLRQVAREVVFLSLNASVSSFKVSNGGETFGILARDVRTNAKENDILITHIDTISHNITDTLNALIFSFSGIRLQTEILSYFLNELLSKESNVQNDKIEDDMDSLIALVTEYAGKTTALQIQIERQLQEVLKYLDQLEQQMMYLGYIQVYGIIEAAGNQNETVSFESIFSQLKTLVQKTSLELEVMQKMGQNFYAENSRLMEQSGSTGKVLDALHEEIALHKQM